MSLSKSRKQKTNPKARGSERLLRVQRRLDRYATFYGELIDSYEKDHPHWRVDKLLWLLEIGLKTLRTGIESNSKGGPSWSNAFATFHYPFEWDWEGWKKDSQSETPVHFGKLTERNTGTRKAALTTISKIAVNHFSFHALQEFTKYSALEKRGSHYTPILNAEVAELLGKVRSQREKQKVLELLFQPFSMGAVPVDFVDSDLEDGKRIPKRAAKQLHAATEAMDLPALEFDVELDGNEMRLLLVFLIHPMVVDVPRRNAYFAIDTGLILVPKPSRKHKNILNLMEQPWLNPENWDASDKSKLWDFLLDAISRLRKEFNPKNELEAGETTISMNVTLTVPHAAHAEAIQTMTAQMLKDFQAKGNVIHFDCSIAQSVSVQTLDSPQFVDLLQTVERSDNAQKKGAALEGLIEILFKSIQGFTVRNRIHTETEEIDLTILNDNSDTRWRNGTPIILVECKNWSSKCGKNEVVQFREKLINRRGKCALGFLVSWNGFSETVTKELLRSSRDDVLIVLLDGSQIRKAIADNAFLLLLQSSWDTAVFV